MIHITNMIAVTAVAIRHIPEIELWFDTTLEVQEDWDLWLRLIRIYEYRIQSIPQTTAIYHRIPQQSSKTNNASRSLADLLRFKNGYDRLVARWDVKKESRISVFREWISAFYAYSKVILESGGTLPHDRYERMLRVLLPTFLANDPPPDPLTSFRDIHDTSIDIPRSAQN